MIKRFTTIGWDKRGPSLGDLVRALGPLGVKVYEDLAYQNSSSFIFSTEELTEAELEKIGYRFDDDEGDWPELQEIDSNG